MLFRIKNAAIRASVLGFYKRLALPVVPNPAGFFLSGLLREELGAARSSCSSPYFDWHGEADQLAVAAGTDEEVETPVGDGMPIEILSGRDPIAGTEAGSNQGWGSGSDICQYGSWSLDTVACSVAE